MPGKKKPIPQKQFLDEYMRSPNYLKRLNRQGYKDPKGAIELRRANLKYTDLLEDNQIDTQYLPSSQTVVINPNAFLPGTGLSRDSGIAHEFSHASGSLEYGYPKMPFPLTLSEGEIGEISKRNKLTGVPLEGRPGATQLSMMHDRRASEVKADMDALRYMLKKDNIYDTGVQDFNKRTLKISKEKYSKDKAIGRLFENFSDDDLIYLMNNIALNQTERTPTIAKNGKYMRLRPKYFEYENLPCIDCKDRLMANYGMNMSPGPRYPMPQIGQAVMDYYGDGPDFQPSTVQGPMPIGSINTDLAIPSPAPKQPPTMPKKGMNAGDAALLALSAVDAAIPGSRRRREVVEPQRTYNPYPYGTGSQAFDYGGDVVGQQQNPLMEMLFQGMGQYFGNIGQAAQSFVNPMSALGGLPTAEGGNWIQKAVNPKHKGYCTPMTKSTCTPRRKALARTFKKMARERKKDDGGIIPDNMNPFQPRDYRQGGNVNGGANIRMVGSGYPNPDLLEQWLLYRQGGNVNGGAEVREVGPMYPNVDLLEQWLLYKQGGTLSPGKAKEMLRDGTANGKKLTKKQKRYFGMVAAGKAAAGDLLTGDPEKPRPLQRPIKDLERFSGTADIAGNNSFTDNQFAMGHEDKRMAKGIDLVNNLVASGMLPNQTDQGAVAARELDPRMLNYLYQFNQRNDIRNMTPDQRVEAFYNIYSGNPDIQSMKDNMRRYGYGPMQFRRTQPSGPAMPLGATASTMRNGGIMYNDGGQMSTMWGGGAELESYNPYDGGTVAFNGASHDDGGIGMSYNGTPVEVEGGEFASRDPEGNLSIYGNMYVPGTRTKFKSVAKKMAKKENRYDFLKTRGAELVEGANPADKYDQLAFNAGRVMMQGGNMGQADLASKKSRLAALQKAMLDTAGEFGLDPQSFSEGKTRKAKGGASIPFFQNGGDPEPTVADRHNNPGNIKWSSFARKHGGQKGEPVKDRPGEFWAKFPTREKGLSVMKSLLKSDNYRNLSVHDAIRRWTDNHPYRYNLGDLDAKRVADLSNDEFEKVINTMQTGEGTQYGVTPRKLPPSAVAAPPPVRVADPGPFTPYSIPGMSLTPDAPAGPVPGVVEPPPITPITVPEDRIPPSNVEPLHVNQLLGEIYAAATNKVEPVPTQRYEPQLFNPYQVSFQDRLNANQSTFNAQARAIGSYNPSALGSLAAQKYAADSGVRAEEFRTNQAIANDITNRNIGLINDAQLKNLALADQQMVRQSEARSRTRALTQGLINSASAKYAQNELENKRLAAYENLYDYRFVPTEDGGQRAQYFGPNAMFNFSGRPTTAAGEDVRTVTRYDKYGNPKGYTQYDDYDSREEERELDLIRKRRQIPLMQVPKLQ